MDHFSPAENLAPITRIEWTFLDSLHDSYFGFPTLAEVKSRLTQVGFICTDEHQSVGKGLFTSIQEVPNEAITLTIPALLSAKHILAIVPETRKADIVVRMLTGPVSPECPASILRKTSYAHLYLDADSGAKTYPLDDK